jgi:hypothetical protein
MSRVAFTTFGILKKPYGNPEIQEYDDLTPDAIEAAERSPGFIARAKEDPEQSQLSNFERDWGEWGKFDVPRFYTGGRTTETDSRASTLSLWNDLDSIFSFVYTGVHRSTMRRRNEWFLKPEWPSYAIWWVADDTIPTWSDSRYRLEHLYDHGSTAVSFGFRHPFAPDGTATRLGGMAKGPEAGA